MRILLVLLALIAAGCAKADQLGGGGGNPATSKPAGIEVSDECVAAFADLTDELTELNSRLNVGLNFADYSERVGSVRVAYDRIKFSNLDAVCIDAIGVPEEDALNAYVRAYNTWNDCIAAAACNDSTDRNLQMEWGKATDLLNDVREILP